MQLWVLASLKSKGQASKLEIQVRAEIRVLCLKSAGWAYSLDTQAGFLCGNPEAEFILLGTSVLG